MRRIKIETLSPVHVGNGKLLQKDIEFVVRQFKADNGEYNKKIGILDERLILDIIGNDNVDLWVSSIERGESILDLIKLRRPDYKLAHVCSRIMLHFGSKSSYVTLKEQLHDGNEKPYIPGSTIKGAIRSALFNTLMNKRRNLGEHEISNGNNRATAQGLEKRLFGEDPNHDILRFLRVGDAYFEKGCTISMELNSLNIVKNGSSVEKSTKSAQLVEAITVDELAEFGMDINLDLWESCISKEKVNGKIEGLSSLENLFSLINKNTLSLIEEELSFWDEDLTNDDVLDYKARLEEVLETTVACQNGKSCVLRLGHGMGWSFIVGNWAKNGEIVNDELWEKIKNASRPNNQQYYRDYAFPKTRRVDADMDVLGFVKLTFA